MLENWVMVVVGIWAMISPWVLGFSSISVAKWDSLIIGLIVMLSNVWVIFGSADAETDGVEPKKGRIESKVKS
ncbi:MAG: hypothetical protein A3B25_02035 [Candidatus Ryanbacteria bacterium RIFCSPLOWO2_01_FULL_48_26]|uniref:SPW repeat-containing integral membrane domain-containing protein n=1 Tax=Candidatus Ryanbacteria bacterium RIFCSPLOWO2_01_FULL_48_26 TaxID=1802126 RepID=A0A1G2GT08_9BACT|nr:MAG: hypothetical protein A3B25_02035 [Candidatus Ryanbacteria bacterium RIFCSPLOWO2_01_FULL_48_26]